MYLSQKCNIHWLKSVCSPKCADVCLIVKHRIWAKAYPRAFIWREQSLQISDKTCMMNYQPKLSSLNHGRTTDGSNPLWRAWCCSFHLDSIPDPSFLIPSSSSIVSMSVPLCLVAAEAKVMETKGGLGINSALTSSFRILSHAKRAGCASGRRGRWQLQPHIEPPSETHTSDWLTNEKGRNSFH